MLDRMIAAQALVHRDTPVTMNPQDSTTVSPWSLGRSERIATPIVAR